MVGGPPIIQQIYPKVGGIILFYDFLNPPIASFPAGARLRGNRNQ
jgi:hypothetical protein